MTKTFKTGVIIFISTCLFLVLRIVASMVTMADNYFDWSFTFISQVVVLGIIPLFLYKRWVNPDEGSIKNDCRIKFNIHPLTYPLSLGLGVVLYFATIFVNAIILTVMYAFGYILPASVGTIYSDNTVLIMSILCTAILPGIFEEIFNRGLFLHTLKGIKNERVVIILGGIFFGLFHENAPQFGYAIFGGLVLTAVALYSKSIVPAMIIHFTNNFINVMIGYSSQQAPQVYNAFQGALDLASPFLILILAALLFVLLKGLGYIKKLNKDYSAQEESPPPVQHTYYPGTYYQEARVQPTLIQEKTKWWEYGFIYATVVMTAIVTVATFLWNFNG